jgi:hypothetical protein
MKCQQQATHITILFAVLLLLEDNHLKRAMANYQPFIPIVLIRTMRIDCHCQSCDLTLEMDCAEMMLLHT